MKKYGFFKKLICLGMIFSLTFTGLSGCGQKKTELVNVSYDATREFYKEYNRLFEDYWYGKTGEKVEVIQSHGGSGKQALEVANGLGADVVTLALEGDVNVIRDEGLIDDGYINDYSDDSSPYTSTIVFLVRKGNPKNIKDWDDLLNDGVKVITPNPKTSGGARWNFLAAWYYFKKQGQTEEQVQASVTKLYKNVAVLDSGARGSSTTFAENGQGDVLIAWENEAFLSVADDPDEFEIVNPSISVLAQPSVAVVDEVAENRGTEEVSREYLNYLYSDEAQRIAGDNYYRPSNEDILKEYADVFDLNVNLVTIDDFGGWEKAQETHFADGGVFDQIYEE